MKYSNSNVKAKYTYQILKKNKDKGNNTSYCQDSNTTYETYSKFLKSFV